MLRGGINYSYYECDNHCVGCSTVERTVAIKASIVIQSKNPNLSVVVGCKMYMGTTAIRINKLFLYKIWPKTIIAKAIKFESFKTIQYLNSLNQSIRK